MFDTFDIPDELTGRGEILPPMVFAAKDAVRLHDWANGSLWKATIMAYRLDEQPRVFEGIHFFSGGSLAGIMGIESETGYPADLHPEAAIRQQAFIEFLRKERLRDVESMGWISRIFEGWEYSVEAKATAAFMVLCEGLTDVAVGYHDDHGKYQRVRINAGATGNDWLDLARRVRPFDSLH